jgi:putative MATE family efflux protein
MDAVAAPLPKAEGETPNTPQKPPQSLWRAFIAFLVPMMLSNVLQSLSGTLNNIFLGHMLGVDALAAATVFFPVMFFFIAFVMGLGMGTTVLVGQAFGAGDHERVRMITGAALALTLIAGVAIALFGGLFTGQLMAALQTPVEIRAEAIAYARVMLISMPVFFVFLLATSILRGVGDAVTPLWVLAISTGVGLILTPLLIRGAIGLPPMGVASAAWASLVSLIVALGWLAWKLHGRGHPLAPNAALMRHVKLNGHILTLVMRIGVPTGVQMVIMAIAEIVLLGLVNRYGPNATAAYGVINQVLAYVQFPAMSIGITASILGAQAIGAGRTHQLWDITRTGLLLNLILTGAGVIAIYLFSRAIIGMFINQPEVVDLTQHLLQIVLWSVIAFGMSVVFSGMMRSSGAVLAPTGISILAILAVEVPTAWLLSAQIGVDGVYVAYPATFCAMMLMQASYFTFVWRKRSIKALA